MDDVRLLHCITGRRQAFSTIYASLYASSPTIGQWPDSRGPYGQNMHFSAKRVTVCTLLWHDSMLFRKPIYTLKNCFGPPSHVLCTCAFLIWIFNRSKNNRVNVLIFTSSERTLFLLHLVKKSAQSDKSCRSYGISKFWWNARERSANNESGKMRGFDSQIQIWGKSENFKSISMYRRVV